MLIVQFMRTAAYFVIGSLFAIAACSGDDGGVVNVDAASLDGSGIDAMWGDPSKLVGTFLVDVTPSLGATAIQGHVYNKPSPQAVIWNQTALDGNCRLLVPHVPFCSTPCGGTVVCVADDTCETQPTKQDVGTVQVSGVHSTAGATTFALVSVNGTYQATTAIAYPPFAVGEPIAVAAAGSAFTPAFTLTAAGIGELVLTSADPALARNSPVDLAWTPPTGAATSQIMVKLDISHHGGAKGKIECVTPDTGSLTLTAPLVTQLLDLGAAGFPTIIVDRVSTGSALTSAGRVELAIRTEVERPVTVPGIQSCTDSSECTPPAICQSDLTCR
jgi:hypothetical protein